MDVHLLGHLRAELLQHRAGVAHRARAVGACLVPACMSMAESLQAQLAQDMCTGSSLLCCEALCSKCAMHRQSA